MTASVYSPAWYRIAELRPRLRRHVVVHRQLYRGERWYLLEDRSNRRSLRFNPAAYTVVGLMDGRRTIESIWRIVCERLGDDAPSQDEIIRLFGELHGHDVVQCDMPPDTLELQQRFERKRRGERLGRLLNPMAIRLPLFDPDRLLERLLPWVRPLMGWAGLFLWFVIVVSAIVAAGVHWPELSRDVSDRVLTPGNLFVIWLVFPILKALHEFGHGLMIKRWGGEVHEMGIMLLVLVPVPYVDAAAAWGFRERHRRVLVGAAGMIVEVFVAAVAMLVWTLVEPGALRSVLYDVMLVSGVSTLVFNANPLLRFDGYYILSDWLEIPNLASRANKYVAWLCQRYLLRVPDLPDPLVSPGERPWLLFFACASFVYRLVVMVAIGLFVASRFFVVGVVLALWSLIVMVVLPLGRIVRYLATDPGLRRRRWRAWGVAGSAATLLWLLVFVVPFPFMTVGEGVVWLSEQGTIRLGGDGFVERIAVSSGSRVEPGTVLVVCDDPELRTRERILRARLDELSIRHRAMMTRDPAEAASIAKEIEVARRELERVRSDLDALVVRSPVAGTFVLPGAADLPGRFLRQGAVVGYIVDPSLLTVRTVVSQLDVDLVRSPEERVTVRPADRLDRIVEARIVRSVPAASDELPSIALSRQGGGTIANDPFARAGNVAFERYFQFELSLSDAGLVGAVGERVYVRFDHGTAPLARQWYRHVKRVFLDLFV